jgi:hypothetical protein
MSCERRIERLADNEYLVKLKVNNNKIVGFGKILEILPDNCSTNRDNDGGAIITQDANSIKFVWFEVPVASSFEVSYRVMCISDGTVPVIRGQVSYTENGNPFTVDVIQVEAPADLGTEIANQTNAAGTDSSFTAANSTTGNNQTAVAQDSTTTGNVSSTGDGNNAQQTNGETQVAANTNTTQQNTSITGNNGGNQVVIANGVDTNTTAQTTQNPVDSRSSEQQQNDKKEDKNAVGNANSNDVSAVVDNTKVTVKSIPSAEKGITYKVQILAAHRVVDKTYLKKKFSFDQDFNIENHNGWIKYTAGSYAQYKDARDARVKITSESSNLPGPFVTAYNDGERITVQEALLISKQLWYK